MLTARQSRRIDFLLKYLIPLLFGFLFDLPWFSQVGISVSLVLATYFAGDFVDALLALWQAFAVGGVVFLIIGLFSDANVNALAAAVSVPLLWLAILGFRYVSRDQDSESRRSTNSSKIVGLGILIFVIVTAPDGMTEAFAFLSAEDNSGWLTSIISVIYERPLSLSASFDSFSVQYFTKFFLNNLLYTSRFGRSIIVDSGVFSLVVLANAWIFALISTAFFVLQIVDKIGQFIGNKPNPLFLMIIAGVNTVLFFRASQDVGHFSQFLLTAVILMFLLTSMGDDCNQRRLQKLVVLVLCLAISLSIVGSYNPWLPISMIGCVLSFNNFFDGKLLRGVFFSKRVVQLALATLVPVFVLVRLLWARYSGLDEQGGVHEVPMEAVWLVGMFILVIGVDIFRRRFLDSKGKPFQESTPFFDSGYLIVTSCCVLLAAILLNFEPNQLSTLTFVLFAGIVFNRKSLNGIISFSRKLTSDPRFDGLLMLGFFSFIYGVAIFGLSRFIGPVYEPMYASKKSMLAVFGQFGWFPLIVIGMQGKFRFRFQSYLKQLFVGIGALFLFGLSPFVGKWELQFEWWLRPSLIAIGENPDAVIVCASPEWRTVDYEVYTCNRFLQTLSNYEYPASGFRYLAWYQPEEFMKISNWFDGAKGRARDFDDNSKVIVLSKSDLDAESKSIFESVPAENLEFRVISHVNSKG